MGILSAQILDLQEKLNKIQVPGKDAQQDKKTLKQEKRSEFHGILKSKKDLLLKKNAILDQIKNLKNLKKQRESQHQKQLDKLKFKSIEQVDQQIK
jgi:hypothetical protein